VGSEKRHPENFYLKNTRKILRRQKKFVSLWPDLNPISGIQRFIRLTLSGLSAILM